MKQKRYWLRGGLVGLLVPIIWALKYFITSINDSGPIGATLMFILILGSEMGVIFFVIGAFSGWMFGKANNYFMKGAVMGLILGVLLFIRAVSNSQGVAQSMDVFEYTTVFLPLEVLKLVVPTTIGGSIVGWIYGKIKNRNIA